jgi:hypothetical protein
MPFDSADRLLSRIVATILVAALMLIASYASAQAPNQPPHPRFPPPQRLVRPGQQPQGIQVNGFEFLVLVLAMAAGAAMLRFLTWRLRERHPTERAERLGGVAGAGVSLVLAAVVAGVFQAAGGPPGRSWVAFVLIAAGMVIGAFKTGQQWAKPVQPADELREGQ